MNEFLISIFVSIVFFGFCLLALGRGWVQVRRQDVDVLLETLRSELAEVKLLLQHEKRERRAEREDMTRQLLDAYKRISELEKREEMLTEKIAEQQVKIENLEELQVKTATGRIRVLGIWPNPDILNLRAEADAIEDVGFVYQPLWGADANQERILRELRIDGFTIVEIGAHGGKDGIIDANGKVLDAGFWAGALERRTIRVALLLACYSDLSVADVFRRSGVTHVIAATGEIADEEIVRFTRVFYQVYADGRNVSAAFRDARLVLNRADRERLVMRS